MKDDSLEIKILEKLEQLSVRLDKIEAELSEFSSKEADFKKSLKPEEVKQIVEEVLQEKTKEIIETLSEKVDEAVDILGEDFSIVGKGQQKILDEACLANYRLEDLMKDVRNVKEVLYDVSRSVSSVRSDISGLSSSVSSGFSRYFSDIDRKERGW